MVVSRAGLGKKDLQQFLDDIVFISKTKDTCSKQSEIVSALHRQINQEKQASQKKPKKKKFPIANQRQLSLYEKGVKSLRERNSRVGKSLKSGYETRPAVRDRTSRKLNQKDLGRTKLSRRMKLESNMKTLERDDTGSFKGRGRNPLSHANSTLSRLHRGLPELFDGLRMDVESLPFSMKHDTRISTKKLSPITKSEKKREHGIHTFKDTQVSSVSSSITSISDSDASVSSLQCDSTPQEMKYEELSIVQLPSKSVAHQEQAKDLIDSKIFSNAKRSLNIEKHECKAHNIRHTLTPEKSSPGNKFSMSSPRCDSTLEKKKYKAVSIEELHSKNIPNQEQIKDFVDAKILNYANRSLGVEKYEHKAHHIRNFHDRYWKMNINFESNSENVEMILNPPVP